MKYNNTVVEGQIVESVMLPTMELLVLTFHKNGTYRIWLLYSSELTPVIEMEKNIPTAFSSYALAYYANKLLSPAAAMKLNLQPSHSW